MPDTALRGINIPPVLDSVGGPEHQNSANTYLAPIDLAVNKKKQHNSYSKMLLSCGSPTLGLGNWIWTT